MNLRELIKKAKKNNRKAQNELYDLYKVKWYAQSLRYHKDSNDASDALQNALVNIFSKLDQFDFDKGEFGAWSSRIVVNENLQLLRKGGNSFLTENIEDKYDLMNPDESPLEALSAQDLTAMIATLPTGYRTVFNLYVIEGYNHREISDMLNISEGTSKSQLSKARKMLQLKLEVLI